jgi:hypothetical protein
MSSAASGGAAHAVAELHLVKALFYVAGPADPGLLSRLIEPFAKLGFVPARVHASSEAGDGSELAVELRVAGLPRRAARQIEYALRAIAGVSQVIAVVEAA